MLDIKLLREETAETRRRLAARGAGDEVRLDSALAADQTWREGLNESEQLKALRNRAAKEIGGLIGQKRTAEAEAKKTEARQLGDRITALDRRIAESEERRNDLLLRLPNLPHPSVPEGRSAEENPVVRVWGEKPAFAFAPRSHVDLCERLGLVDFARGAKLAGSGFLLYMGWGARLERALIQFLLNLHTREHGYTEVSPPFLVNRDCMTGVGQFPKFIDQAYAVREGQDDSALGRLYLVPTAEAPVANIHGMRFCGRTSSRSIIAPTVPASAPRRARRGSAPGA
jgi:seryl-tRNA synthetase